MNVLLLIYYSNEPVIVILSRDPSDIDPILTEAFSY